MKRFLPSGDRARHRGSRHWPSPPAAVTLKAVTDEGGGASGSVSVDGSSTVFPMSDAAAELLSEENPDIKVTVGESGTGGGFERFCAGETDISDASRPIDEEDEVPVCEDAGVEYTELQVATDALTVVVHPDLDVDCLTVEQLVELWEPGSHGHQLEPARPELPRPGDHPVRPRHRLRHLRLHGRRRDRRRVESRHP